MLLKVENPTNERLNILREFESSNKRDVNKKAYPLLIPAK